MTKPKLKKNRKSNGQSTGSKPYASAPKPWIVVNNGQDIVLPLTTFWDSDFAHKGLFYLSFNDGAARLLVPDVHLGSLEDMRSGKMAVLTRGPYPEVRLLECMEILFDDGTHEPYSIHLSPGAYSQMLPDSDIGKDFPLHVWTRTAKVASLDAKYRRTQSLPLLTPWTGAELAYANLKEERAVLDAFNGEFESRIFPYVIRAANELTGGGAEKMDWRSVTPTSEKIYVAPILDGLIAAGIWRRVPLQVSADAFGMVCCIIAYSQIVHSPSPLAERCLHQYRVLRECMWVHLESSAICALTD